MPYSTKNPGKLPCAPTAHVISEKPFLRWKDQEVCGTKEPQKCSFQSKPFLPPKSTRIIRTDTFGGAYFRVRLCPSCITPGCSKYSAPSCGAQKHKPLTPQTEVGSMIPPTNNTTKRATMHKDQVLWKKILQITPSTNFYDYRLLCNNVKFWDSIKDSSTELIFFSKTLQCWTDDGKHVL